MNTRRRGIARRRTSRLALFCALAGMIASCSSTANDGLGTIADGGDAADADGSRDGAAESSADANDAATDAVLDAPDCGPSFDGSADPANCGECGHDCRGSACAGGLCAPVMLKTGIQYSASLTAKSGLVFYAAYTEGHVFPDDGGPERTTGAFGCTGGSEFGFDPQATYFMCSPGEGTVNRETFGGTTKSVLEDAGGTPYAVDIDDANAYWGNSDGELHRTLKDGGGGTTQITQHLGVGAAPQGLQVRGGYIYWRVEAPVLRRIATTATSAATPPALVDDATLRLFYVDDAHIYVTTTTGDLKRLDLDGSNPVTLVAGDGHTRLDKVFADATHVYWTTEHGDVRRALKTDGSHVLTVASMGADASTSSDWPVGVASSGDWVFYLISDPGILLKVAR
jgi:hypothetical protein